MRSSRLVAVSVSGAAVLLFINASPKAATTTNALPPPPSSSPPPPPDAMASLGIDGCGRLFVDAGANLGESVDAFVAGNYYRCALSGPPRIYKSDWTRLGGAARQERMAPLSQPGSFCVRSFEAAPALLPPLRAREDALRARGLDVRFVDGMLSNATTARAPRKVYTYSGHPQGQSASHFAFDDVHLAPGGVVKPRALAAATVVGASYDLIELVQRVLQRNASAVVAVRLDVEGLEYALVEALLLSGALCGLSYLFVEFHHSATDAQRASLPAYGLPADVFEALKVRVHAAMEAPGCRLQLYWRSFWASCGDQQRFEWRDSAQAVTRTSEGPR